MKFKFLNIIIMLFVLCLVQMSCQQKFKDEDLIIRYINENEDKFENNDELHLLVLRHFQLSCSAAHFGYDVNMTITKVKDSLQIDELFLLFDNEHYSMIVQNQFSNDSLIFILDSPQTLDDYAFPYTPHLFHIKDMKIKNWKEVYYKKQIKSFRKISWN